MKFALKVYSDHYDAPEFVEVEIDDRLKNRVASARKALADIGCSEVHFEHGFDWSAPNQDSEAATSVEPFSTSLVVDKHGFRFVAEIGEQDIETDSMTFDRYDAALAGNHNGLMSDFLLMFESNESGGEFQCYAETFEHAREQLSDFLVSGNETLEHCSVSKIENPGPVLLQASLS